MYGHLADGSIHECHSLHEDGTIRTLLYSIEQLAKVKN
jgi:hypothetical protein